jgi:hypothetical protein
MALIVVGFSKPKTWKPFAWLIQTAYGTSYDHVYVKLPCLEFNKDIIYQASGMKVNFMGVDVFKSENVILDQFDVDVLPENRIKMIQFAIDNAGKPYSLKEIFGFFIVRAAFWCGKNISNPFRDGTNAYVCSELVSYLLQEFDSEELPKNYQDMTPRDVYEFLDSVAGKLGSGVTRSKSS